MIFNRDLLRGRVAVVTGGGTGIGKGIALELARVGASVAVVSRKEEHVWPASEEIKALGVDSLAITADIRDEVQVGIMVDTVIDRFGRIDILVNNAGGQFMSPAEQMSLKGWKTVIDLNLNGTFICTKLVGQHMIKQRYGRIINIIASFVRRGSPGIAHSGAARAGVEHLTRTLALEWARYNITVNAIAPMVLTEGLRDELLASPGAEERMLATIPLRRWGTAEQAGYAVVFLASEAGSIITGETLAMDGGNWLGLGISFLGY